MRDFIDLALSTEEAERVYHIRPELKEGCPTCEGNSTYRWQGQDHDCDCQRQLQLAKHYTAAGIGKDFQRLSLDDWHGDEQIRQEVEHYLEHWKGYVDLGRGIIFYGDYGTGKTFLANMILKYLVREGVRCYATTFSDMIEEFTATWGDKTKKQWFQDTFMYTGVLLLDELGREGRSSHNLPQSTFDRILRNRVQNARPTLLTTNIKPDDLDLGYGGAVLSQLKRSCFTVEVTGSDYGPTNFRLGNAQVSAQERRPVV